MPSGKVAPTAMVRAQERWRVGALAKAAGLTVRSLHHYDALGLLTPSLRTEAGHRLYTAKDVGRLYRILALRQFGFRLDQIAGMLDRREGDLQAVVRGQLEQVERQLEAQTALRARLTSLLDALGRMEQPTTDSLIEMMEAMTMFERYYTPEQLAKIEERRQQLGEEGMRRAEQEWADLIAEAEAAQQQGLDPASPRVQEIARHWRALVAQFTGSDEGITRSLRTMYETEGVDKASHGMMKPELMEYIGKAMAAGGGERQ